MSNVFATVISGSGALAVPESDAALAAASAALAALVDTVPSLTYESCLAFVRDDDGGSLRTLNCLLTGIEYAGGICPSAASTQTMLAAIKAALLSSPAVSAVDVQQANLVQQAGGGSLSFPGIENIWFVDQGSNVITDGTVQQPFHSIQDGIDAAGDNDLVLVYPGTYVEQITAKFGVQVRGVDQLSCILENTGADAATAPLADTPVGEWHIENMTIRATGGDGSIIHRLGNNAPLGIQHEFIDCHFTGGQFQEIPHRSMTSVLFLRCRSTGDTNGFYMTGDMTSGRQIRIRFSEHKMDCSPVFSSTHGAGGTQIICFNATRPGDTSVDWTVEGDWQFAAGASWIGGAGGGLKFGSSSSLNLYLCYLDGGVLFTDDPGSVQVLNCVFENVPGGTGDMDVDPAGPTQVVVNRYSGNSQHQGLAGAIVLPSSERAVGGDQQDRYMDLQAACTSVVADDTVIRLREDVSLNDTLVLEDYSLKIDGDGKHTLQGPGHAGSLIAALRDNQKLEFENIELSGVVEVGGDAAELRIGHNVDMEGSVRVTGGNSDTKVVIDHATLEGSLTFPYPIVIQNQYPTIKVMGNSFVRGYDGSLGFEAVRYEIDNKNLQVEWSTLTHGSIGVGNNPFINTVGGSIGYSSHHSVYNADPAGGGSFNNAVFVNYDIYDTAAVY